MFQIRLKAVVGTFRLCCLVAEAVYSFHQTCYLMAAEVVDKFLLCCHLDIVDRFRLCRYSDIADMFQIRLEAVGMFRLFPTEVGNLPLIRLEIVAGQTFRPAEVVENLRIVHSDISPILADENLLDCLLRPLEKGEAYLIQV